MFRISYTFNYKNEAARAMKEIYRIMCMNNEDWKPRFYNTI